ncbi:hypothetical protein B9Z55_022664 [Caenorhabditis nigoni]|uniref:RSD-2 N-terminal domain-containing protein n=1 Tax=Caenorhabditis nigoni TaxID=1611254 RepID=A0A2G5SLN5_9PELO|nr:hypothetical protein B9Z55_022664 [Caenorhabditis nigoni]
MNEFKLVLEDNGPPQMKTHLVFSKNNNYETYNRSCGFSNRFGLVEIADPVDGLLKRIRHYQGPTWKGLFGRRSKTRTMDNPEQIQFR